MTYHLGTYIVLASSWHCWSEIYYYCYLINGTLPPNNLNLNFSLKYLDSNCLMSSSHPHSQHTQTKRRSTGSLLLVYNCKPCFEHLNYADCCYGLNCEHPLPKFIRPNLSAPECDLIWR